MKLAETEYVKRRKQREKRCTFIRCKLDRVTTTQPLAEKFHYIIGVTSDCKHTLKRSLKSEILYNCNFLSRQISYQFGGFRSFWLIIRLIDTKS